jgi:hypothetical protein
VLARNPDEARIVHATFDQLYGAPEDETAPLAVPQDAAKPARRKLRRGWIAGLIAAALALALILGALLWPREVPKPIPLPPAQAAPRTAPPPPEIPDTIRTPDWERSFTAGAGVATGLFLWLFGVRLRRETRHRARRKMVESADSLPGPHRYEISLEDLAPPFTRELLDDTAGLLGRRTTIPPRHGDLDVERTLARTLRAGLAPQIVLRARASTHPILVLEDVGDEMRPWRRRVSALLDGLETRGVPIDRWRFHADAGRVVRNPGEAPLSLKQLFRLRAESPLLVVSTGEGLLEGIAGRPASWVEALRGWRYRAWLHPVTDPAYWRPALRAAPIQEWPMTPAGVMAAARQLIHGETGRPEGDSARALPQRRVSPLDVERLRWLLTLAPRRDPDLAELLRQRFCPQVPPAALLEALEAPPLTARPGVGPTAEEVHAFLADLLAKSEPQPGTAAHERWRLDRALQEIRLPGREEPATRDLAELAQGPLAAEVVSTVERWTGKRESPFRKRVLRQAFTQAGHGGEERSGWRWTWPDLTEIAAALVCLGLLGAVLPSLSGGFERKTPVQLEKVFRLRVGDPINSGLGVLGMEPLQRTNVPQEARLYQDGHSFEAVPISTGSRFIQVPTGHWYDLRQPLGDGRLAVSEAPVWVETFFEPALPVTYPEPPSDPKGGTEGPDQDPDQFESSADAATRRKLLTRLESLAKQLDQSPGYRLIGRDEDELKNLQDKLNTARPSELAGISQDIDKFAERLAQRIPPAAPPGPQRLDPKIESIKPDSGSPGEKLYLLYLIGSDFDPQATVSFNPEGISVSSCKITAQVIICQIEISPDAVPGERNVVFRYPDRKGETFPITFTVRGEPATAN